MSSAPLLERLATEGASVAIDGGESAAPGSVNDLVAAIRAAVAAPDSAAADAAWARAGDLHTPETLDGALAAVAPALGIPILNGLRRRRLRESARRALRTTGEAGVLRLTAAILGAVGEGRDAADLETLAIHPELTLHGATALANLHHWEGRASLLRLLSAVAGAERVLVIDRLLPFVREPAVRLALVRDGFTGLDEVHARDVAPAVVDALDLSAWLAEPRVDDELREAARRVLALAGRPAN